MTTDELRTAPIRTFTIGFTKKNAEQFLTKLQQAGVRRVIDVRLNNVSQLAGFAKRDDLRYFLRAIHGIEYIQAPDLAPTADILDAYKKHDGDWAVYEDQFLELMDKRRIQDNISRDIFREGCLLCSEHLPDHCHRRLVIEYLQRHWGVIDATHLV
jgi:uncharacterized protein (DUF488 family)